MRLYTSALSGYCHRIELMLSLLKRPYERIEIDFRKSEQRSAAYLKINALGEVPALIDDDGTVYTESNAILVYLALSAKSDLLPTDPKGAAAVQVWLSRTSSDTAQGPATARIILKFGQAGDLESAQRKTRHLLSKMETALSASTFLASERLTIADVAMYGYISTVKEGGVQLDECPTVQRWLTKIESEPDFVPFDR